MTTINIGYLIPHLRLYLGDTNQAAYRYMTDWLQVALQASVKSLGAWWDNRYLVDDDGLIYRDPNYYFEETEPPTVLPQHERPIVLMAAIIVLEGSLENSAWNIGSWKDNEVSYSNIESGRIRNDRIKRLWDELLFLLTPPGKKLAGTTKQSLPGYLNNAWERGTEL